MFGDKGEMDCEGTLLVFVRWWCKAFYGGPSVEPKPENNGGGHLAGQLVLSLFWFPGLAWAFCLGCSILDPEGARTGNVAGGTARKIKCCRGIQPQEMLRGGWWSGKWTKYSEVGGHSKKMLQGGSGKHWKLGRGVGELFSFRPPYDLTWNSPYLTIKFQEGFPKCQVYVNFPPTL